MTGILQALFDELGYHDPEKQRMVTALLQRAGVLNSPKNNVSEQAGPASGTLVLLSPAQIQSNPEVYQFRFGGDAQGVTNKGRHQADKWDPVLHGDPLLVHERLGGSLFVADGHHRLELAKRLNTQGRGPEKVAATILREADGYSALDVKIIAAYKNIAHGRANPVEAALVLKDAASGNVNKNLLPELPMEKGNLPLAARLAKLTRKALSYLSSDKVPVAMGEEVAIRVHDPIQQEAIMHIISKKLQDGGYAEKIRREQSQKSAGFELA